MKTIVDGLEINYREEGAGSPVLLLHGWGCNGGHWDPVLGTLKESHRVVAPDIPGFGESEEPPNTWGTKEYALFFEHFMRKLKMEQPAVIGHSNGGRIAIALAAKGRAGKLILTDSAGIKPKRDISYYAKIYSYKAMKKVLSLPGFSEKKGELLEKTRGKAGSDDYNAASEGMRRILSTVVNEDLTPLLEQIRVSTLLIWGSEDTATPLADGERMEGILKKNKVDCALIVFNGRGHYAFLEEKQRFISVCQAFI